MTRKETVHLKCVLYSFTKVLQLYTTYHVKQISQTNWLRSDLNPWTRLQHKQYSVHHRTVYVPFCAGRNRGSAGLGRETNKRSGGDRTVWSVGGSGRYAYTLELRSQGDSAGPGRASYKNVALEVSELRQIRPRLHHQMKHYRKVQAAHLYPQQCMGQRFLSHL